MELAFRARLPGHIHLQLHELNPALTQITELPIEAPQWLGTIPGCSPGLASLYGPTSRVPASLTRTHDNPSTKAPTPIDYAIYKIGAHSYLPLLYGPSYGPTCRLRVHCPAAPGPATANGPGQGPTRYYRLITTPLDTRLNLPLLYGPSSRASPPTRSPVPGCTGTCGASPQTPATNAKMDSNPSLRAPPIFRLAAPQRTKSQQDRRR